MKAVVYHGPKDIRVEDMPTPEADKGELVIQVLAASICGTDLRIYHGQHKQFPEGTIRIPGHEVTGTIVDVGSGAEGYAIHQGVFVAPNVGCGRCRHCIRGNNNLCRNYEAIGVTMDGGFAEYMRVPARYVRQGNVIPIRESVDPAVAALTEPFACVLRGQNALHIEPGDLVLVIGAGPIGVMHTKLAKLRGAGRVLVSEPIPERAAQVAHMGADLVVNPMVENLSEIVDRETSGEGADVIVVAAPVHTAQEFALELASVGGRINFFGGLPKDRPNIHFNSNLVHYKELIVTGTTACSTADCEQAVRILNEGLIDLHELVSQRFPLEKAEGAFSAAENRQSLKIAITP